MNDTKWHRPSPLHETHTTTYKNTTPHDTLHTNTGTLSHLAPSSNLSYFLTSLHLTHSYHYSLAHLRQPYFDLIQLRLMYRLQRVTVTVLWEVQV